MRDALLEDLGVDIEKDIETTRFYYQEKLILEVTEVISGLMKKKMMNRTKLAELLGKSRGHVTQLLDGTANMTLRTISDVFVALGAEFNVSAVPLNLGIGEDSEYEVQDEKQFTSELPSNDLIEIHWTTPNRMVA